MTAEEIVARLVYRDGLMLVIDKPAGLAVHKGPKGGESLEDYFDALRFGLPRPPRPSPRPRYIRLPGARPLSEGAGGAWPTIQGRTDWQNLLGGGRRRAGAGGGPHRPAARPQGRHAW